jgi:hypothetical protein
MAVNRIVEIAALRYPFLTLFSYPYLSTSRSSRLNLVKNSLYKVIPYFVLLILASAFSYIYGS